MKKGKAAKSRNRSPAFVLEKEEMLKAIGGALERMNFSDPAEAQAFLDQFVGMKMADITASLSPENREPSDEERADECFFAALDASTPATIKKKLKEALRHDPDHVRALAAMAFLEKKPEKVEQGLRHAISAGERKLGPLLDEGNGQLWGFVEARPYLEVRAELARFLADMDRLDESIEEHQRILELNTNDNQGVRDPLLGLLLEARRYDEARALARRYDTSYSAIWLYAKALLKFIQCAEKAGWDISRLDADWMGGQMAAAGKGIAPAIPEAVRKADAALIKAIKFNPWCAIHLLKLHEHLDDEPPVMYSPGSREEAVHFTEHHASAWAKHPAALLWLGLVAMPWLLKNGFESELV